MARKEGKWRRLFFSPSAPILECYVTDSHFARLTYSLRFETELTLKLDLGIKQDGEKDFGKKKKSDSWEAVEEEDEVGVGAQFFFIFGGFHI